ncbi:MAG TPA: hypothetical protein VM888_08205 [Chitinophagaceae bacterium]|nr:hypothetical protein [Chitinophagaceae bacterium]
MKQLIISLLILIAGCNGKRKPVNAVDPLPPPFVSSPAGSHVAPGIIDEASGIADSRLNAGSLWVEEDSGNPPQLYLLQHNGSLLKKIYINNAQNRDWEDLTLGAGPTDDLNYLYVADIGDNDSKYSSYNIYRFPEPPATADTVHNPDKLTFVYPDGAHDAEALVVDNRTKDIYIITKRGSKSKVYKLPYPQSTKEVNVAVFVMGLPFDGVVSAATSKNGEEIIIKTYTGLFYWQRKSSETIETALARARTVLPYKLEPQGEAVCFKSDNGGFFTLSERRSSAISLNFYKRL